MLIETVTHCYAARLSHYADALCYQLSSIYLTPRVTFDVKPTVCYNLGDKKTVAVLRYFESRLPLLNPIEMPLPLLGRRSIGRNTAALRTQADVVWFTDADVIFGDGCLEALVAYRKQSWREWTAIVFPRSGWLSSSHEEGQELLNGLSGKVRVAALPEDISLIPKRYFRAIGPIQITRGDLARQHGYLNKHDRWQQPRTDNQPFRDFRDDLAFRGQYKRLGKIEPIDLPNMIRIRHEATTH